MPDASDLSAYADLLVSFGANVQPGQIVAIGAELGKEELVRALVASAYRHGARFVDVAYFDPHVKRERILHADPVSLDFVPPWYGDRVRALGEHRCARIGLTGPAVPGLLDDLDPSLVGRDQLPFVRENGEVVNERTTNWTAGACPTAPWAQLVHPDLDPDAALARLWREIAHVCRLDAPDPVAAWRERMDVVAAAAQGLTARHFDALHFSGPGTDLTVGLMPTSTWRAARFETIDGIEHMPNIPSEECFTTPDPDRVDGVVRATKPLVAAGVTIEGLEVRFDGGRAVEIDARTGAGTLRALADRDPGAARIGEVALVDRESRIGQLGTVFYDTLIDENAASHIALGRAYEFCLGAEDRPRANRSEIHVDFMIGSGEVDVDGIGPEGERVPVLREGAWQSL